MEYVAKRTRRTTWSVQKSCGVKLEDSRFFVITELTVLGEQVLRWIPCVPAHGLVVINSFSLVVQIYTCTSGQNQKQNEKHVRY